MNKLTKLTDSLRANTVLVVENDFTYSDNPYHIVGKFCHLPSWEREQILLILARKYPDLSDGLKSFYLNFEKITHDQVAREQLPASLYLKEYITKVGHDEILNTNLFENLAKYLADDHDDKLKDTLLRYGIYSTINDSHYTEVLKELENSKYSTLLLKKAPTSEELHDFRLEIEAAMNHTSSNFCLAIVDKSLESGGGDDGGRTLVNELISINKDDTIDAKFICCIYTSRKSPNPKALSEYDHYFVQEIGKNDSDVINSIATVLAQSAYAEVFYSLSRKAVYSAEKACEIVLRNQKNIKYIIDASQNEGIPAFESIKHWFNLTMQKNFDDNEINQVQFLAGLTAFFNQDYLDDHPSFYEITDELKKINSYELFDYTVNTRHLSIAPGDIWESNGRYFILVGQLCDFLVRKGKVARNSKIGELYEIDFLKSPPNSKFDINITGNQKYIEIRHFFDAELGKYRDIKINISTPNIFYADLKVLDLATFNKDGNCSINTENTIDQEAINLLPSSYLQYYDKLKNNYLNIAKLRVRELASLVELEDPMDFSRMDFTREGHTITHPIKRICRLKGRFYDSLYNNHLNNKGRIDLNLIDNSPIYFNKVSASCYFAQDNGNSVTAALDLLESKGEFSLRKEDLLENLPEAFHDLINNQPDVIEITNPKGLEITHNEDESTLTICFRYLMEGNNRYANSDRSSFGIKQLFTQPKSYSKSSYYTSNPSEIHPLTGAQFSIEELKIGICIPDKNKFVVLRNGILIQEEIEK